MNVALIIIDENSNPVDINFTLDNGGSISRRIITETTFEAISGVHIDVWDYNTGELYSCADTGSDGTYTVHGLPAGQHRLYTNTSFYQLPYINEYYNDTTDYAKETPISVSVGQDTPNINFIITPTNLSGSKSLLGTLWKTNKASIIMKLIRFAGIIKEPALIPKNFYFFLNPWWR